MPLVVIGTERKPNKSDLKSRDPTGLPDPGPDVALLRAKLEAEQAELRAMVEYSGIGIPESFVRMDVDVVEADEVDVSGCDEDVGGLDQEESLGSESEGLEMQVDEKAGKLEEKELGPGDDADKSCMPVVDGVDVGEGNEDVEHLKQDNLDTESKAFAVQVEKTACKIEKKGLGLGDGADKSSMPFVEGPSEAGKSVRILRHRNPIQIHPYVLEREGYQRMKKAGRR